MLGKHLTGQNVELLPPDNEAASAYYRWMASPEINRFLLPPPRIVKGIEVLWLKDVADSKTQITWGIYANGQHIGFTRIYSIDWLNRRAYGATWLGDVASSARGYAAEAVRLRNEFVFTETTIEKLEVEVFVDNTASQSLVKKLGYRHYGVAQRHYLRDGEWHDVWLAELLKADWLALQAAT